MTGRIWRCRDLTLPLGERTLVMGVVNVTPDSFSDGGLFADADDAVAHGARLADEGADIVDIGGESTRPRAEPVSSGSMPPARASRSASTPGTPASRRRASVPARRS
jgi:hypothetical protein